MFVRSAQVRIMDSVVENYFGEIMIFFKQNAAYKMPKCLEFRRVLFRSLQQIRGNCSPLSMSTTRLPPMRLCSTTVRPGLSSALPTRTESSEPETFFIRSEERRVG